MTQSKISEKEKQVIHYNKPPLEPTDKQIKDLLSLNRHMKLSHESWLDTIIKKDQNLQQRVQDKNDPLMDYEIETNILFRHKKTKTILAVINTFEGRGISTNPERIDYLRNNNFDFIYQMQFYNGVTICEWFARLLGNNKLNWYDLLSIGEIELEIKIYNQYFCYIKDSEKERQI